MFTTRGSIDPLDSGHEHTEGRVLRTGWAAFIWERILSVGTFYRYQVKMNVVVIDGPAPDGHFTGPSARDLAKRDGHWTCRVLRRRTAPSYFVLLPTTSGGRSLNPRCRRIPRGHIHGSCDGVGQRYAPPGPPPVLGPIQITTAYEPLSLGRPYRRGICQELQPLSAWPEAGRPGDRWWPLPYSLEQFERPRDRYKNGWSVKTSSMD
jgi:hypothetical protein